jgi:hypothetical protein
VYECSSLKARLLEKGDTGSDKKTTFRRLNLTAGYHRITLKSAVKKFFLITDISTQYLLRSVMQKNRLSRGPHFISALESRAMLSHFCSVASPVSEVSDATSSDAADPQSMTASDGSQLNYCSSLPPQCGFIPQDTSATEDTTAADESSDGEDLVATTDDTSAEDTTATEDTMAADDSSDGEDLVATTDDTSAEGTTRPKTQWPLTILPMAKS